jgi:hypothetical protein
VRAVRRRRHSLAYLPDPAPSPGIPPQPGPGPPVPVRPASWHVRDVHLMDITIVLLAAACIIVSGLLAWHWLSWRAERRAEESAEYRRAQGRAAPRPRAGALRA